MTSEVSPQAFGYACEHCSTEVWLTREEYDALALDQSLTARRPREAARVLCPDCRSVYRKPVL